MDWTQSSILSRASKITWNQASEDHEKGSRSIAYWMGCVHEELRRADISTYGIITNV